MPQNLSPHFTLEELLRSDQASSQGFAEQFNPPVEVVESLKELCIRVLEPLREKISASLQKDAPIKITSGYRCPRLNESVGSKNTSQHLKGEAVDTHVVGLSTEEWYQFIKNSGIPFDQIIQEFGLWVHIGFNTSGTQRGDCKRAKKVNGNTVYEPDGVIVFRK